MLSFDIKSHNLPSRGCGSET